MTDPQSPARVLYRSALLAEQPPVQTAGDGVFVALAQPMPVRATLRLVAEDGTARGFVVERVVETGEGSEYGITGVVGRYVDDEALAKSAVVGSEHLASAELGERPVADTTAQSDGSDGTNAAMAMPAPVMVGGEDDEDDEDDDDDASDAAGYAQTAAEDDAPATSEDDPPKRRGRRRRGKKRT